jgi:hypothetical protein
MRWRKACDDQFISRHYCPIDRLLYTGPQTRKLEKGYDRKLFMAQGTMLHMLLPDAKADPCAGYQAGAKATPHEYRLFAKFSNTNLFLRLKQLVFTRCKLAQPKTIPHHEA